MIFGNNRIFRPETTKGKTGNWTKREAENGQEKRRERLEERRCVSLLFRLCEVCCALFVVGVCYKYQPKGGIKMMGVLSTCFFWVDVEGGHETSHDPQSEEHVIPWSGLLMLQVQRGGPKSSGVSFNQSEKILVNFNAYVHAC